MPESRAEKAASGAKASGKTTAKAAGGTTGRATGKTAAKTTVKKTTAKAPGRTGAGTLAAADRKPSAKVVAAAPTAAPVPAEPAPAAPPAPVALPPRLAVRKTYKLYVGGAFPRSESGRSYAVTDKSGGFLAHAALASRKDARDAVRAARSAFAGWSGATAYNRGQVLYRIAEMLEGRREQFAAELRSVEGGSAAKALEQVDAAVDRWVWYAGWTDKITQVRGAVNPVAGPYWNVSSPEPTGVVAAIAPAAPGLLGLVSVVAPIVAGGNAVVVVAPGASAVPAMTFAEVLATSDLPGGVVNILTGKAAELGPPLAAHLDVDALDLTGLAGDRLAVELEIAGAQNLKRVRRPAAGTDWHADPGLGALTAFLETKTVWHPVG